MFYWKATYSRIFGAAQIGLDGESKTKTMTSTKLEGKRSKEGNRKSWVREGEYDQNTLFKIKKKTLKMCIKRQQFFQCGPIIQKKIFILWILFSDFPIKIKTAFTAICSF